MPSPLCEVKDGAGAYVSTDDGVDVTPGETVTIHLIDTSADTWSLSCVYTDDEADVDAVNASLTRNETLRTVTFEAPEDGHTYIFQSVVNNGVSQGRVNRSYTTTFGVYTRTENGDRVISANETTEGGDFGWIVPINNIIRSGGGSVAVAGDIEKHAGVIDRVEGFNGTPLETADTPANGELWLYDENDGKYRAGKPVPPGTVDVKRYGATGDGVTDDAPAINAAIQASGSEAPYGGTVLFPPGVYRIASSIHVTRGVVLKGTVRGHWPVAKIKADVLVTAIIVHSTITTPETDGDGQHSAIRDLFIESTVSAISVWTANEAGITVGTKRRRVDDNRYYQEAVAVTTGICGATEPTWSNRLLNSEQGPGTSDLTPPQYNTVVDGGVTWQTKIHAGILLYRRAQVSDVFVYSVTNAGICAHGDGYFALSNVNGTIIERCRTSITGVGIEAGQGDGNACTVSACDIEAPGYGQSGTGGHGIVDASFLGNVYIGNQVAVGTGRPFYTPDVNGDGYSTWIGCYSEGGALPSKVKGLVLGGDHGSGFASDSTHVGYHRNDGGVFRNVAVKDPLHAKAPILSLDKPAGSPVRRAFLARESNDDQSGTMLAERYESDDGITDAYWKATESMADPPGWWVTGIHGAMTRRIIGLSGSKAPEGNGHFRVFRGEFRGDYNNPYYLGVASDSKIDPFIRVTQGVGGHLKPGDRFEGRVTGTTGTFIGEKVVTEGWTAPRAWATTADDMIPYDYYYDGRPSMAVHPTTPNGYTYVVTKRGATHATTEPTWPTSYLGSGGIAPYSWRTGVTRKIGDYGAPSTRNGHYYRVTAVAGADANGYAYVGGSEPTWPTSGGGTVVDGGVTWTEQGSDVGTYVADNTCEWTCVGPVPVFKDYGEVA